MGKGREEGKGRGRESERRIRGMLGRRGVGRRLRGKSEKGG